jgi:hypothetical protein
MNVPYVVDFTTLATTNAFQSRWTFINWGFGTSVLDMTWGGAGIPPSIMQFDGDNTNGSGIRSSNIYFGNPLDPTTSSINSYGESYLAGKSEFAGRIIYTPVTLTLANGLNSNIADPQTSFARVSGPTGAFSVGGFVAANDGTWLRIYNPLAQTMTVVNEDVSSTAANRIKTLTGADIVLAATAASFVDLQYDSVAVRWIVVGNS